MMCKFSPNFEDQYLQEKINFYIDNFTKEGNFLNDGQRNRIKVFELEGKIINIKSFKMPNAVNKIVYRFFRKSKAERSFIYAHHLLSRNIGTPKPIAYAEEKTRISFQRSFYVSEQQDYDLTYRELVSQPNYPDHENILRAFTRFTHKLHENNIEFLDHSPGNTLIRMGEGEYRFFLVDLNRMTFKSMNLDERLKNFSRLTPKKQMVEVMASEYALLINKPYEEVFNKMWYFTEEFQKRFHRKQAFKKKLKFWKK